MGGQGMGYWCAAEPSIKHGKGEQCRMSPRDKGPSPTSGGAWAGHGSNHCISSQSCLQGF